ncbi:beta-induced protein ig-h3 [Seminavis robusta]|uniref:Beta-induced protein ig-h3 n=1 Tax=Seminavis robusta TaxID=568900 RepID=A0A9N8H303_9STRA|nr:beta-induced protein ig-h3 [Seminavis robusta]|eukprot:Sro28_g018640.1 beta-induced protein ig-h3 (345) ;mRNA; r:50533-51785
MKFTNAVLALSSSLFLSSVSAQDSTIVEIAESTGSHTTLVDLVTKAGLVDTLNGAGPFTLFGPTDDAFAALNGAADKFTTPEFSEHLVDILTYHVIGAKVTSADLVDGPVAMVNGEDASVTASPPMINTANIIAPFDAEGSNGVVHSTDAVLLPTSVTSDIVDIAAGADAFSTLVDLVTTAGLVDTLKGEGPFTVFAPTNDAFAELPEETVALLTSPEGKDQLIDILTYHVVAGNVYASQVPAEGEITMVNGDAAMVKNDGSMVMINDAMVVMDQILASNGVIHPINKVILPPADDASAPPAPEEGATGAPATPAPTPESTTSAAAFVGTAFAAVSAAVAMLML